MVKDLGLARLGLGDQGLVEDIENILADLFEFGLDLLTVIPDDANVLVDALLLLLLLDGGDDAPRCTAGTDDVLVGDRKKVALVDSEFTGDLEVRVSPIVGVRYSRVGCVPLRLPGEMVSSVLVRS